MSESTSREAEGFLSYFALQIGGAVSVQAAICFTAGPFWVICCMPVLFAAYGAVNLHDVDATTDFLFKRLLTFATIFCLGLAWTYKMFFIVP